MYYHNYRCVYNPRQYRYVVSLTCSRLAHICKDKLSTFPILTKVVFEGEEYSRILNNVNDINDLVNGQENHLRAIKLRV